MPGLQRVIVKLRDSATPPVTDGWPVERILDELNLLARIRGLYPQHRVRFERLVSSVAPARMRALSEAARQANHTTPLINSFTRILLEPGAGVGSLGALLDALPIVEYWYIEPDGANPTDVRPSDDPLFVDQGYLRPAPEGLDVEALWERAGASGTGVSFVDVEQGWTLNHDQLVEEDTKAPRAQLLGNGKNSSEFQIRRHGTRVLGVIFAADDDASAVGVAPDVSSPYVAPYLCYCDEEPTENRSDGMAAAIDTLAYDGGGVLLLEIQLVEPLQQADSSNPNPPVEACQAEFELIRLATSLPTPIVVVECAGNGGRDLDLYDQPDRRHLRRTEDLEDDSGAIMVAGATSDDTHRATESTNIGSRIDCYAWGENVVSLSAPPSDPFKGTSAAGAIIAGVCVAIQGTRLAEQQPMLTSQAMRSLLASSDGTPVFDRATGNPSNQIGVMPDLRPFADSGPDNS